MAACEAAGLTRLASVGGDIGLNDPDALMLLRFKGAMAAREVAKIRERVKRKHQELAERGLYHGGGTRPFGFRADRVTVDEAEAALIREAADRILSGESLYAVRQDWNTRPVPTVTGAPWTVTAIRTFLTRPRTAGLRQHQGAWSWDQPAQWPAILDRETWEQVRAILHDPSRRQPPPSRQYPLRGVLACAECGRHLVAMPRSGRRNYGCRKESGGCGRVYVSADHVERLVLGTVLPLADHPALRRLVDSEREEDAREARRLVMENSGDEAALLQLEADHYQDRVIDRSTFLRQSQALRVRIEGRQGRLAAMRGHSALDRLGGEVMAKWDEATADEKRAIVLSLVHGVRVSRALRKGSNMFDPARVRFLWRYGELAKLAVDADFEGSEAWDEAGNKYEVVIGPA